jgi:hypothetical protein
MATKYRTTWALANRTARKTDDEVYEAKYRDELRRDNYEDKVEAVLAFAGFDFD